MEQQPFESQLALVRSLGPMGKASVAAFRRPPSRAVRKFWFAIEVAMFRFAHARDLYYAPRECRTRKTLSMLRTLREKAVPWCATAP